MSRVTRLLLPLLPMYEVACPASADTVSAALASGDAHFSRGQYDQAAMAYEPALRDSELRGRGADLKFLLRGLSDRFYREDRRFQRGPAQ